MTKFPSLCFFLSFGVLQGAQGAQPFSAIVTELEGNARTRPRGKVNWKPLTLNASVFPGDTVFVGSKSRLTLQYIDSSAERPVASVQLSESTLLRVQRSPPLQTKLRRRFAFERKGTKTPEAGGAEGSEQVLVRNVARDGDAANDESSPATIPAGPRVQRDVRTLELLMPRDNTTVFASRFPTTMLVKVKSRFAGQDMWAYLWSSKDSVKPLWSGFSKGEFPQVPISKPGFYEIQVLLDDDTASSVPLTIEFRRPLAKEALAWGDLLPAVSKWVQTPSRATLQVE